MRVTVCEFQNDPEGIQTDWEQLVSHVQQTQSRFVLLPEMPFCPWLAHERQADGALWQAAVKAHDEFEKRLPELFPAVVAGSRPAIRSGQRVNEGFIYTKESGYLPIHQKYYLPEEEGFWESSWYRRGDGRFEVVQAGPALVGFLICTEQWFGVHARTYGKQGVHLVLCPRATPAASTEKWLAGGVATAVVSGAFCLSSNRGGIDSQGMNWGGTGWIVEPQEGVVLALTDRQQPFKTVDIDLTAAERAKATYPRYVEE
jgi:N-carbamoylputrescine amidase